jgi:TatD DNase family protein
MSGLIDTHAHLTWPSFDGEVEATLDRAREAGVKAVITLGTDLASSRAARRIAHDHSDVFFAAGVHPNDAGEAKQGDVEGIEELLGDPRCVALGEIGMDFYREHTDPEVQERWLRRQLELARQMQKPVVLHDRKASRRLLEVLDAEGYDGVKGPGGVFHCFAGDAAFAAEVVRRGFHISFTGNITYKKSDRPQVAATVPLDRLMVETDSPFLAPVPRRGRPNEPAYLPYVAAGLASALGVTLEEVERATTANAEGFFGLPGGEGAA